MRCDKLKRGAKWAAAAFARQREDMRNIRPLGQDFARQRGHALQRKDGITAARKRESGMHGLAQRRQIRPKQAKEENDQLLRKLEAR